MHIPRCMCRNFSPSNMWFPWIRPRLGAKHFYPLSHLASLVSIITIICSCEQTTVFIHDFTILAGFSWVVPLLLLPVVAFVTALNQKVN